MLLDAPLRCKEGSNLVIRNMSRSLRKFRIYNLGINQSNHIIQHSIIKENLEKQFFIQLKL
jgi:hypothetical protein